MSVCARVWVCVCVRERERERESNELQLIDEIKKICKIRLLSFTDFIRIEMIVLLKTKRNVKRCNFKIYQNHFDP